MEIKITTQMNMQVRKTEIKVNRKRRQRREIIAVVDKKRSFAVRKKYGIIFRYGLRLWQKSFGFERLNGFLCRMLKTK